MNEEKTLEICNQLSALHADLKLHSSRGIEVPNSQLGIFLMDYLQVEGAMKEVLDLMIEIHGAEIVDDTRSRMRGGKYKAIGYDTGRC